MAGEKDLVLRVLVVDTERVVRDVVQLVLERAGFNVFLAETAEQGFVLAARLDRIDLVFVEELMSPGPLRGRQIAEHIRQFHPEAKVLLTSGLPLGLARDRFLPKPFKANEL
jgi:DNA-binding response OmpR family regulator